MLRLYTLATLLLGFVCATANAQVQVQVDPNAVLEFWGEQSLPLDQANYEDDAVFFEDTAEQAVEEELVQELQQELSEPCDHDVTMEDAMMMEGDLERLRFSLSDERPTFVITTSPAVRPPIGSLFGSFMQQIAVDPVQDWMDRQLRTAQQMSLIPSMPQIMETYQGYDDELQEATVEDEFMNLENLSRLRFAPAMSDLMAGADRQVSETKSGYTDDGARWTSSQGVSQDGTSQWYSFSMSYGGKDEAPQPQARVSQTAESQEEEDPESNEGEEEREPVDSEDDWSAWMSSWSGTQKPFVSTSVYRATQKRNRATCAVLIGCAAGVAFALISLAGWWAYRVTADAPVVTDVQEPLLAPVSETDRADACLVVAADHADLEKHYVNIKYVPLNGE